MEKIQVRLEELNPEIHKMVKELEDIGWDLEDYYKDLWEGSNQKIQSEKYNLEKVTYFSNWIKNFRVEPH